MILPTSPSNMPARTIIAETILVLATRKLSLVHLYNESKASPFASPKMVVTKSYMGYFDATSLSQPSTSHTRDHAKGGSHYLNFCELCLFKQRSIGSAPISLLSYVFSQTLYPSEPDGFLRSVDIGYCTSPPTQPGAADSNSNTDPNKTGLWYLVDRS